METTTAPGARVVGGDPQPPGLAGVGEAPADDLVEAEVAHRVLGPAPQPLRAGQPADLAHRGRQGRGQVLVEAVDPADLLDQVDLAGDVAVAVGRDLDQELAVGGVDAEPEPLEVGDLVGLLDLHPEQLADSLLAQADVVVGRDLGGDVDRPRHQLRAAELDQQPRGDRSGARMQSSGCSPFSNRADASERSPSLREVRRMLVPFQLADLEQDPGRLSETSETWPPMIPAIPEGPSRSQTRTVSASKVRSTPSRVVIRLALGGGADDQRSPSGTRSRSKAWSGCAVSSIT